jgi:hypothetical protein
MKTVGMKTFAKIAGFALPALMVAGLSSVPARGQSPAVITPIIVDTAVPIIVNTIKPKPKYVGLGKFEGYVMHANIAQITVRAKGDDMSLETFSLSQEASARMQAIVDKGGYQYGDKVTVYFDPTTKQALKVKGKPSKAI